MKNIKWFNLHINIKEMILMTNKPKSLYPKREPKKIHMSKTMIILMIIMDILLCYICFVITIQSVYCIPMA